jgi:nicotinamidase-related amidase
MRPTKAALRLTLVLGLMMTVSACEREGRPAESQGTTTALMLMDFQRDFLQADGRKPVAQNEVEPMIKAANAMIDAMRKLPLPVIYIRDEFSQFQFISNMRRNYAALRTEPGAEFDPRIDYLAGVYFTKDEGNAFSNPRLESHLRTIGCANIVIAGVFANRSMFWTAKRAMRLGYKVTVISDAVAAASDGTREAALNDLKQAGAKVETSVQFISSLMPESGQKNAG